MGNVPDAVIIGGTIQLIYLGLVPAGSNIPADEALAACIAIPIAIKTNMSPAMAVTLAVPLGVLGIFLDSIRRTVNAFFVHMADAYAEKANTRGIYLCATIYPMIFQLPLRIIPVFLAYIYGPEAVTTFMKSVPAWMMHGLDITGGVLPALGFAITIMVIGRRGLLPYFIAGFFLVKYTATNIMAAAIFGTCFAFIHTYLQYNKQEGGTSCDE
jgi:Phosphotransferase system, mannose/fructose/N-acetylgalactosamine-specific component IIC